MSGPDGGLGQAPYGPAPYGPAPYGPAPYGPAGGAGGSGHGYQSAAQPRPSRQPFAAGQPFPVGGQVDPSVRRRGPDPAKLLGLAVAGLGGLNFIWGFLPEITAPRITENLSVFAVGPGYVPILLLIAGLLALAAFLPGSEWSRLAVAAVSVGGAVGAIVALGMAGPVELLASGTTSKGLGAILLVIFGIIQAVIAIGGYVIGADFSSRATGNAVASAVTGPIATVQPGWPGPPVSGAPGGFPPPAPMPYSDAAVTGPQVVIGSESRSRETASAPAGPTGPPTPDASIVAMNTPAADDAGAGDTGESGQPHPPDHRQH